MSSIDKDVDAVHPSPTAASETSSRLDDTYEAYKNNRGIEVDPVEHKKTLRKIDTRVVPILFFIYLLQYLDKNGINYASAFGFIEATKLGKNGYSWLGERCTVTYILCSKLTALFL
jgi:hypothetical protein